MHYSKLLTRSAKAFTLIELLVVIAIIAILAAILFPVFAQARAKARQTQCASDEKQIGLAIIQYVQDYDEHFPMCWSGYWGNVGVPGAYASGTYTLEDELNPYIKTYAIWKCPDSLKTTTTRPSDIGYNYALLGWDSSNPTGPTYTAQISDIVAPSSTIMCADIMWAVWYNGGTATWASWSGGGGNQVVSGWTEWGGPNLNSNLPVLGFPSQLNGPKNNWTNIIGNWDEEGYLDSIRHQGRDNVLYIDGHVKTTTVGYEYGHGLTDLLCEWCNGH